MYVIPYYYHLFLIVKRFRLLLSSLITTKFYMISYEEFKRIHKHTPLIIQQDFESHFALEIIH